MHCASFKVTKLNNEDLPYKIGRERELAILQEVLKKYCGDFYVERRYQAIRLSSALVDRDALLAEYREQMQNSDPDLT